jgi:hypothetical protein
MVKEREHSADERSDVLVQVDTLIAKQREHNRQLLALEQKVKGYLGHKVARVALKEVFNGNCTQRALEVLDLEMQFCQELTQSIIDRLQ